MVSSKYVNGQVLCDDGSLDRIVRTKEENIRRSLEPVYDYNTVARIRVPIKLIFVAHRYEEGIPSELDDRQEYLYGRILLATSTSRRLRLRAYCGVWK